MILTFLSHWFKYVSSLQATCNSVLNPIWYLICESNPVAFIVITDTSGFNSVVSFCIFSCLPCFYPFLSSMCWWAFFPFFCFSRCDGNDSLCFCSSFVTHKILNIDTFLKSLKVYSVSFLLPSKKKALANSASSLPVSMFLFYRSSYLSSVNTKVAFLKINS